MKMVNFPLRTQVIICLMDFLLINYFYCIFLASVISDLQLSTKSEEVNIFNDFIIDFKLYKNQINSFCFVDYFVD